MIELRGLAGPVCSCPRLARKLWSWHARDELLLARNEHLAKAWKLIVQAAFPSVSSLSEHSCLVAANEERPAREVRSRRPVNYAEPEAKLDAKDSQDDSAPSSQEDSETDASDSDLDTDEEEEGGQSTPEVAEEAAIAETLANLADPSTTGGYANPRWG